MKPSVQNLKSNQPKMLSKREDKKSVNHKWNSRLFFQLGLVISLIVTTLVMESTIGFSAKSIFVERGDPIMDPAMITYVIDKPEPIVVQKKEKVKQKRVIQKKIITTTIIPIADNLANKIETPLATTDTPTVSGTSEVIPNKSENKSVPDNINTVEFVPIFPGCESLSNNEERKACLSDKIRAFISKKFDTEEFSYLDSDKVFRISVEFKIDVNGNVSEIRSRAPEKSLEEEAIRVINLLPSMKPGMQGATPVEVLYRVPITFKTN